MGNDYYQSLKDMESDLNGGKQILVGIGERCFISHALVDKNCRIDSNDVYIMVVKHLKISELYAIKDGIVLIKRSCNTK
jgi:glucose-1-phosphate adenylyltransferase